MAPSVGRNDPCPCGSGKKYKRCCLGLHQEADRNRESLPPVTSLEEVYDDADALDQLSNRVVDLIEEGRLEEAEERCRELRERYPEQVDWMERFAMVYEARGDGPRAAEYYRKAAAFAERAGDFDEETIEDWRATARRLDPRTSV
jgi:tetratricopeptide (TPR) repeat protein